MGSKIVIFTGGRLGEWALFLANSASYIIGADSGAWFLVRNGISPDLSIGDFDSVTEAQLKQIERGSKQTLACDAIDKNYTDTELAFLKAVEQQPSEIVIVGGLGTRFDHSLANVHLLVQAAAAGIEAVIMDEHNEIRLVTNKLSVNKGDHPTVSLLPLTEQVDGINLTGFKYPLHNATLAMGQSLGISNVLGEKTGHISISSGKLLVIQSKD
ncbi:thiamine diphosphokinase [Paenibacillus sp. GCM10012307]|uniref:Thiamine diphosphokinase n=1 Tax=Paenibacillus roseus TaxID=2798579 RepID=A0A934MMS3_9BACL|nr:thiamine diphosphokinase [Paenibacillus roseus]MBJ6363670.1 thiamine diphosphokinase [Paenibacillus roseus]